MAGAVRLLSLHGIENLPRDTDDEGGVYTGRELFSKLGNRQAGKPECLYTGGA